MEKKRVKAFISYSWADGKLHTDWVLKLANDLIKIWGVEIILDQYELATGHNLTGFMDKGLLTSDKVIIICSPSYKSKAEERVRGTGYEYSLISQELFNSQNKNLKFIPVLRIGSSQDSIPGYLASLVYFNMVDDNEYQSNLQKLARDIWDEPELKKPELGAIPNFDNIDEIKFDSNIEKLKANQSQKNLEKQKKKLFDSTFEINQIMMNSFSEIIKFIKKRLEEYREFSEIRMDFSATQNTNPIQVFSRSEDSSSYFNLVGNDKVFFFCELNISAKTISLNQYNQRFFPISDRGIVFRGDRPNLISSIATYTLEFDKSLSPIWYTINNPELTSIEVAKSILEFFINTVLDN